MEMYTIKAKQMGFFVEKDPYKCKLKIKDFSMEGRFILYIHYF